MKTRKYFNVFRLNKYLSNFTLLSYLDFKSLIGKNGLINRG